MCRFYIVVPMVGVLVLIPLNSGYKGWKMLILKAYNGFFSPYEAHTFKNMDLKCIGNQLWIVT